MISPLTLQIMIAYYVSSAAPEQFFQTRTWDSEPALAARIWLRDNGLIDEEHGATVRGHFWLNEMLETPLPVQTYVSGRKDSPNEQ